MKGSYQPEILATTRKLMARGKGILAADESTPTLTKRFDKLSITSTAETRMAWRELLFSSPGLSEWISGVILYDETIRQNNPEGRGFVEMLDKWGIIAGIKLDTGAKPLAGFIGETVTEGLDGLNQRVEEYYKLGARFAKWRAVISISETSPTDACIEANAHALARYAKICQEGGLVPIVEPEVLMDGEHSIEVCYSVTERTLLAVFEQLRVQEVKLEAMILKPSMVLPASDSPAQVSTTEVAEATVKCYLRNVPAAVGGIALLSGGQKEENATAHLAAMNKLGPLPWPLTFSYGRALQDRPMRIWGGKQENSSDTQAALLELAQANSQASIPSS